MSQQIASDTTIDPALREKLSTQLVALAAAPASATLGYGKLVYRVIAVSLGLVALLVVVFVFVLTLHGHTVDAAFYSIASAAVGALGGAFSTHDQSSTPAPHNNAATPDNQPAQPAQAK